MRGRKRRKNPLSFFFAAFKQRKTPLSAQSSPWRRRRQCQCAATLAFRRCPLAKKKKMQQRQRLLLQQWRERRCLHRRRRRRRRMPRRRRRRLSLCSPHPCSLLRSSPQVGSTVSGDSIACSHVELKTVRGALRHGKRRENPLSMHRRVLFSLFLSLSTPHLSFFLSLSFPSNTL